jgi:hypothetical protein
MKIQEILFGSTKSLSTGEIVDCAEAVKKLNTEKRFDAAELAKELKALFLDTAYEDDMDNAPDVKAAFDYFVAELNADELGMTKEKVNALKRVKVSALKLILNKLDL